MAAPYAVVALVMPADASHLCHHTFLMRTLVEAGKAVAAELLDSRPDFFLVQIFTMNRAESFRILKKEIRKGFN